MDFEEITLDAAESTTSDVLISESCIGNIIAQLGDCEKNTERNGDPPQLLSTTISRQNSDQPNEGGEPVNQTPFSPRCPAKDIEDYILNTRKEKPNQISKDMEAEEAILDTAESIESDVLISDNCIENIIAKLDSYESPTFVKKLDQLQPLTIVHQTPERKSDQIQPLSMTITNQKSDQHLYQDKEPVDRTPPSPRCSQRVVEDHSLYFSQDSTQSTLPPTDSQQGSTVFPLSIGNCFKQDFPVSTDRIEKTTNFQQTKKKMSEPTMMKQIKEIHNRLNLCLKNGELFKQEDELLLANAKQMLYSLKQKQAALCDSLKNAFKHKTPSNRFHPAMKKRIDLLQKRQHKLLLLFQAHNAITKKIKALNQEIGKQIENERERQFWHPSQKTDVSSLQTRNEEIPNAIVTAFDDDQSESASTVYSLRSQVWSRKIKPKSPNLPVSKRNAQVNKGPSLCLDQLNENSTDMSTGFSRKRSAIPSTNLPQKVSLMPSDIPSINISNNISLQPSAIPSNYMSNDFSPEATTIPLTNISNNLSLNTIPSTNLSNDFSLMPSTSMSNKASHKTSAIPSAIISNNLSLNTLPLTNLSNDCSLKSSSIPSTNISNGFSSEASDIPSTNMSNNLSLNTIPLINLSNDCSLKPSVIPPNNLSNDSSVNSIQPTNISRKISVKPPTMPSTNMSNDFSSEASAIPSTNTSNDSSFTPSLQNLMNQKKKPKSPNSLFCEPNLNTRKEVKDDHNYSVFPQSQGSTYKSPQTLERKTNHPINNFLPDSHFALNSKPNQTSHHNIPSLVPLSNNEPSLCPSSLNNMSNGATLKPFPGILPNCQQYTIIPIGTTADFANGQFLKNISHNQQNFNSKLVPKSATTSAHQGGQSSGMSNQEPIKIPVHSRDDQLGISPNVSNISAKRIESLVAWETEKSRRSISDLKSKHSNEKTICSKKNQTDLEDPTGQMNTSLTHVTLIEDQELMPLYTILPSCQNTDCFGSINFPKVLWDGFHIWP